MAWLNDEKLQPARGIDITHVHDTWIPTHCCPINLLAIGTLTQLLVLDDQLSNVCRWGFVRHTQEAYRAASLELELRPAAATDD
jgi:hypothetical protein